MRKALKSNNDPEENIDCRKEKYIFCEKGSGRNCDMSKKEIVQKLEESISARKTHKEN